MQQPPNPEQPYPQQPTQPPYYNPQQTPLPPPPYVYGNYPPQQPPMMPRKSKRWPWIVALIVAFIFGDMVGHSGHTTSDTTAAAPISPNTSITQPATTQPSKPLVWTTTQKFSGNGNQKTTVFTVPDTWRIVWSCTPDPSANSIGGYVFSVNVDNSDTSMADLDALSGECKPGNISQITTEHQAGSVYLDVISGSGPWAITVQEMK